MIVDITADTRDQIQNASLAAYADIYLRIYEDFIRQLAATGIEIAADDDTAEAEARRTRLRERGVTFGNGGRSIYVNGISPACVACRKGIGSATFFVSLDCHRDCYYCFNPNQEGYAYHVSHRRDLVAEMDEIKAGGQRLNHVAVSGGEPLLHPDEVTAFLAHTGELFPDAFRRLYTCGDHASDAVLARLQEAGLEEIRFSIRMHDLEKGHQHTLERIAAARDYVPRVMVEMPVMPDATPRMKQLLLELDALGIHSINLLELCYPLANAPEFRRRGYEVRRRPFRVLYNYWYAGGVPIAGSELACLDLVEFAVDHELSLGVHYCSLENKLTGQNYQQNFGHTAPRTAVFSERDYLWKTAKVFGRDVQPVRRRLRQQGYRSAQYDPDYDALSFHVSRIPTLAGLDVEIGLSTATLEARDGDLMFRELKVDLTRPEWFDQETDV